MPEEEKKTVDLDTSGPEVSSSTVFFSSSGIVSSYVNTHARCPLDYRLLLKLHRRLADASPHLLFRFGYLHILQT